MYARYVPPSKGGSSANATTPIASAAVAAPASEAKAPPPLADGYSYSRYIPGAKAASEPRPTAAGQVQYFEDAFNPPKPKRKWEQVGDLLENQKSKKSRNDEPDAQERASLEATHEEEGDLEKPKKKKRSRRSKKRTAASEEPEEDIPQPGPEVPEPETVPVPAEEEVKEKEAKEKKKEKKKDKQKDGKKRRKADEESTREPADLEPQQEQEDVSMLDAEDPTDVPNDSTETLEEDVELKEKKKRDKKKKKKEPEATEEQEEDEALDQRHKAVLERKAKSLKIASEAVQAEPEAEDLGDLHGLEPLPQPEPANIDTSRPSCETLPSWLAEPIRVSQDTRTPFSELGVLPKASRVLEEKGYQDAFAVQTAALPLLLPTSKHQHGDVLISAATGSGKTLAYALPIVGDISQGLVTRLRALVVLPTRELVKQAQEAFELCAKAYEGGDRKRVRIGISIGSQSLKYEQECLVDRETRYDPEAHERIRQETELRQAGLLDLDLQDADPRLSTMGGHVIDFSSKVDVLICTPGRLVEHMEQTPGFSLDYVRWLVVDEADKLLAQSFQGWLDLVLEKFKVNRFSAREFPDIDLSGVRKVILSATLTRDLSLLNQLALRRPRLIVLESDANAQIAEHSLPMLLKEFAVRVHDTNLKPLYLLELLQGPHMGVVSPKAEPVQPDANDSSDSDTSSSDDSSDSDSDDSSSSSDTSSSDSSDNSDSDSGSKQSSATPKRPRTLNIPASLIFTKSNEAALRLSRLLALLDPALAPHIGTLTSTTPTHLRRKTLRAFTTESSPIRLLIASDLVARGIDLPNLDHVINYDLPPSVAGYVHRVGRTARAGRSGCAWTLVGDDESGWFWGKIAKGTGVRRAQKVDRTRIEEMSEERVETYEAALEKLGKEAGR